MNYELAKSLKDAGFPQDFSGDPYWVWEKGSSISERIEDTGINKLKIKVPSLSELILACGDEFGGLAKRLDGEGFYAWGSDFTHDYKDPAPKGEGETLEETVARLWLKLNKK